MKNIKFKLRENKNEPVKVPNIDSLNNYSLDEQKIGTWIDGKNLYQVTLIIKIPTPTNTWTHLLDITRYNIDILVKYSGIIHHQNVFLQLDYDDNHSWCILQFNRDATEISGYYVEGFVNDTIYVTIQYTKKD